jgi:hypothetical protein
MTANFDLRDVVMMKKPHACGTNSWTIIRVGADIKIKCNACGRIVMMDRTDFVRSCKKVIEHSESGGKAETDKVDTI